MNGTLKDDEEKLYFTIGLSNRGHACIVTYTPRANVLYE